MSTAKRDMKLFRFYNEAGEKYPSSEIIYKAESAQIRKRVLCDLLRSNPNALTLDIGCSDGYYKPYIKNYVGLDIALARLKKFTGRRVWAVAEHLPFADKTFDRIFMSETLEHTWKRKQILKDCHRILKDKGTLIISVPFGKHPFHIIKKWDMLEKYDISYSSYIHGHFTKYYTRNMMRHSKFHITLLKIVKKKFIVVKAKKMFKALWTIFAHKHSPLFWQWANRVNFIDKLIIKNHMHHEAHRIGMKYFFNHPEYDYYIISTDDALGTPYHLKLLLEDAEKYGFPVVSGWCSIDPQKNGLASLTVKPCHPNVIKNRKVLPYGYPFISIKDVMIGKYGYPFIKAWFNGVALNLVRRETLRKVPYRPFKLQRDRLCLTPETKKRGRGVMFDLQFAFDCARNKVPIKVDTRIFLLHAKTKSKSKVGVEKKSIQFVKAKKRL